MLRNVFAWTWTCAVLCLPAVGQEVKNITATSRLPQGPGLSAGFAADQGIASHAAVIFAEDFESSGFEDRWDEVRNEGGQIVKRVPHVEDAMGLGNMGLEVQADLRSNTGGGLTRWFESADSVFFRWHVRFDPDCDYIHHFCTVRANKGLEGGDRWSGFGGAGEKPMGDTRFSTALEPWGNWGKFPPPGRWNFYSYWQDMQPAPDGKFWGNSFMSDNASDIPKGKWIACEMMIRHNAPGEADGEQAYWIDGELRGHWRGFRWRSTPTLWANAFTLESYVTDRWTKQPINTVRFDNVVIAKEYIGPATAQARAR